MNTNSLQECNNYLWSENCTPSNGYQNSGWWFIDVSTRKHCIRSLPRLCRSAMPVIAQTYKFRLFVFKVVVETGEVCFRRKIDVDKRSQSLIKRFYFKYSIVANHNSGLWKLYFVFCYFYNHCSLSERSLYLYWSYFQISSLFITRISCLKLYHCLRYLS